MNISNYYELYTRNTTLLCIKKAVKLNLRPLDLWFYDIVKYSNMLSA